MATNPTPETHIPVTAFIPADDHESMADGRPPIDPPSLWQRSVKVRHKATGRSAVVARVDRSTNMFRAFYPDEGPLDENGNPRGRLATRIEWEQCRDWDPEVTFSPRELERRAAQRALDEEVSKLDKASLGLVTVLCEDPDPRKALAKLEALRSMGVLKASAEAAAMAVAEASAAKKGR